MAPIDYIVPMLAGAYAVLIVLVVFVWWMEGK